MTIKVYKKRTIWYFQYHCEEYQLGYLDFLDALEKAFDKKVFHISIELSQFNSADKLCIRRNWFDYRYNAVTQTFIKLFNPTTVINSFVFNSKVENLLLSRCIIIHNIK